VLNVYSFVPQGAHASYYLRVQTPLMTARDLGLPIRTIIDTNKEGVNPEQRIKNFCEADIVLLYQPIGEGTLHNIRMAKSFIPSKRDGDWKYPPTVIMDTDDNLCRVDPHNPAFGGLGFRDPETGKEIPKGHSISELVDGVRRLLWKDGAKLEDGSVPFDVARNKAAIDTYRQIINEADCVTCTTPRTANYVQEEASPRRVHIFPNMVRFADYVQLDLMPHPHEIRILWQGGQNHEMDWRPLRQQLGNITKKYPQVHWVMWGVDYKKTTELVPPERITFLPWAPYEEYKLRRVMIGEDISLAPLSPDLFNDCRSAIKWYEASVSKRPAATLAQNTGPYRDEIKDGETGLLFNTPEEFEENLSLLIEDTEQRKTLAANAKDWVNENRDAFKEVPKLIGYYERLREEIKYDQPHMPDSAWEAFEKQMEEQAKKEQEEQQKKQEPQLQPA